MITLATLAEATAQEVLDQVWRGLIKQNVKSETEVSGRRTCLYRGPDGTKCAAGHIMTDAEAAALENSNWCDLVQDDKVTMSHGTLIYELQNVHDYIKVNNWPEELAKVASEHNLKPTEGDNE